MGRINKINFNLIKLGLIKINPKQTEGKNMQYYKTI